MNKRLLGMAALIALAGCAAKPMQKCEAIDSSAWEMAEWISVADAPVVEGIVRDGSRAADGASWFVCEIENPKRISAARWMTTGLGVYELHVNGQIVGEEILKPGFTHPYKTRRSFTYDILPAMRRKAGEVNVLAVQVTPGWWADKIVTPAGRNGMLGRKCAFRGVLELTYADGSTELIGTDTTSWKAGIAGPVKHAAIFDGEEYDARELPGYATPEKLSTPEINREFAGEILPSDGAEIYLRKDLALSPVRAYAWEGVEGKSDEEYGKVLISKEFANGEAMRINPGETLVVDFGQNSSAVPAFEFSASEGTLLLCEMSELLNDGNGKKSRGMDGPEGSAHRLNLRIPDSGMKLSYTFAGKGRESYSPRCTFFGYRFLSITADAPVSISKIESIPVSSMTRELETGRISTGNELVNKLISNTWWGQISNYLSVPTDCPQRNERLGWTADTQVFAETGTFFADTRSFFHKWMRDMRDSQGKTGGYPGVAPYAQYGDDMFRVGWSDAGVIVPWTVWKQFGDTSIIDECWESMERNMAHVALTKYDHNLLKEENRNYQWADWLSYEPLESCSGRSRGPDRKLLPETIDYWNYLGASYWAIDAAMMRDMAAATGRDAAKYEAMLAEAKAYIKDNFMLEDGSFRTPILNTMQTPVLFALKNGLLEGPAHERAVAALRANFAEHDGCLQTGFLGTSILMPTLSENGMSDIAYQLLYQRKNPSWLYSIDNGATTIWERWNSYMIEYGMGPKGMNSFNHYAYGVVCQWLWESAAGIAADTSAPGFRHIIMKPVPDRGLGHLEAEYRSAAGLIKSSWKYEGDKWIWDFTIPEGSTATVTLPGSEESRDYPAGSYRVEVDDPE